MPPSIKGRAAFFWMRNGPPDAPRYLDTGSKHQTQPSGADDERCLPATGRGPLAPPKELKRTVLSDRVASC